MSVAEHPTFDNLSITNHSSNGMTKKWYKRMLLLGFREFILGFFNFFYFALFLCFFPISLILANLPRLYLTFPTKLHRSGWGRQGLLQVDLWNVGGMEKTRWVYGVRQVRGTRQKKTVDKSACISIVVGTRFPLLYAESHPEISIYTLFVFLFLLEEFQSPIRMQDVPQPHTHTYAAQADVTGGHLL